MCYEFRDEEMYGSRSICIRKATVVSQSFNVSNWESLYVKYLKEYFSSRETKNNNKIFSGKKELK